MGIISWFQSRRPSWFGSHVPDGFPDEPRSLVTDIGADSTRDEKIKQAAAADIAEIEKDDKYFGANSPGNQEDDL
jgi:hypothetical protein